MALQTPDERLNRLEQIVQIIAEDHLSQREDHDSLRSLIANLAAETHNAFDQVAARFDQVAAQFRETDARIDKVAHESAERGRVSDERVDRLVLAIGELIRRQDAGAKQ